MNVAVYICHCGTNIAGVVDVASLTGYASTLPGVAVARHYKYMCSDPGQALLHQDVAERGVDRIVVAACSPTLHEKTFRQAAARAGLNPYYVQMVNIREQDAWVHTDHSAATAKARDLVRAAVRRVRLHRPLERTRVPIHPGVVVVGGGIAGIHAALTLADGGNHVYLVEREPTIGGHMAKFDKTFPTLDCAACILTPKMTAVRTHPNITLWTLAEVTRVDGSVGRFDVTVTRRPRYVDEEACVGCYECIDACVYKEGRTPDEFNVGLGKRRPIYVPFPQAVPPVAVIDADTCIEFKSHKCKKTCVTACGDREAIDFSQRDRVETVTVGSVIVATGFKTFDASRVAHYGYGVFPNVYTALEIERMVNASGPTGGEVRLRDGRVPSSIGIVHCVGSRDEHTNRYCSRVCCMYSLKLAHLVREKTDATVYNCYIDIRTPGKGFEEFYNRVAEEGVHFIRGKVADVCPAEPGSDRVIMRVDDTLLGMVRQIPVDMLILAVGLEPQPDATAVRRLFGMSCSSEGFFLERHPKLAPVNTSGDGIFLAGCCQSPKDIPDTVAQAGAAAAEALALVQAGVVELEPNTAYVVDESCSGCKTCMSLCPYHAIHIDEASRHAAVNESLCKGCGTCVAACPSGALAQHLFEDDEVLEELEGLLTYA
jgi:heterodisulfide reductase subunit A